MESDTSKTKINYSGGEEWYMGRVYCLDCSQIKGRWTCKTKIYVNTFKSGWTFGAQGIIEDVYKYKDYAFTPMLMEPFNEVPKFLKQYE